MSSNSVRVSAELFQSAQEQGTDMMRSAAQQVEHWARLGKALEEAGLSTGEMLAVLRGAVAATTKSSRTKRALSVEVVSEEELWAHKRAKQAKDIANVDSGKVSAMAMGWFSSKRIKQAEIPNSPY
ncbi:TA system antitoxin ParD family protein [Mitsuaria sp. 7]|uniref:TA system antitoxin ParD family protein n=1 Tax=Mitsuaria sp. 7 TaxID=1658665 RepID=UPI000837A136|nr:hypothetical protein [Mitsuaria sp. 7]